MLKQALFLIFCLSILFACEKDESCKKIFDYNVSHIFLHDTLERIFDDYFPVNAGQAATPDCTTETITQYPNHGQLIQRSDTMLYIPDSSFIGVDSFEYEDRFCKLRREKIMVWENKGAKCLYEFRLFEPCLAGYGVVPDKNITFRVAPFDCKDCITSVNYTYVPSQGRIVEEPTYFWTYFILNSGVEKLKDRIEYEVCINCNGQQECKSYRIDFHIKKH